MSTKARLDALAERFEASPDLYESFCALVHDASNDAAANALNSGEGLEWLVLLGWSAEDIETALDGGN